MRFTRLLPGLVLALALAPATAAADSHQPVKNLVSLSVSVNEDVPNDLLVVRMYVQHEARQQAQASKRVNEDMAWALAKAKAVTAVKAQTLDYRTNPVYNDRRLESWRTRQALSLESADTDALTELMGVLQERLSIESVGYQVSDAVREAAHARLIDAAVEQFSARAAQIAAAFGRQGYTLVNVDIHTQGHAPPPIAYRGRAMAMSAEDAAPSIEAGDQSVSVTASGTVELAP